MLNVNPFSLLLSAIVPSCAPAKSFTIMALGCKLSAGGLLGFTLRLSCSESMSRLLQQDGLERADE